LLCAILLGVSRYIDPIFFCFAVIGLSAQTPTVDQKFLGVWTDDGNNPWVFRADGTGHYRGTNFRFAAFSGKVVITSSSWDYGFEYYFSTDNRTLILFSTSTVSSRFLLKNN